jgi:hypothetical protein
MSITKEITAQNTYSDSIDISADYFSVSVQGSFTATVTLQKSYDGGTTWHDVDTFTSAGEYVGLEGEGAKYRIGVKTGEYTIGTINVRIGV